MSKTTAYIGLGSNIGDRRSYIDDALRMLAACEQIELGPVSEIIETEPLAAADQPMYLNAVARLRTTLAAADLHETLVRTEDSLGRIRGSKWSDRTIDLDLLMFGREVIDRPDLVIPHPQMHLRSFVLRGLCQIAPDLVHPVLNERVDELARRLRGLDFIIDAELPQLVSVAGNIGAGKTTLAKKLAERLGADILLEAYDTNPFLPDVYAGRNELALDSQLYFLASRVKQLGSDVLARGRIWISDYIFDKELIYARRLLDAQQFALYEDLYYLVCGNIARPMLVLYMCDSPQNCLERVHSRNRPYEQRIRLPFLDALGGDYEGLFREWKGCPVVRLPRAEDVDFEHLTNQVRHYVADDVILADDPMPAGK